MDTCANEAIPQWGKHDLIGHVYLRIMSMVMKQCCGFLLLVLCWKKLLVPHIELETYYCIMTLDVSSFISVCHSQWRSDKVL